MTLPHSLGAIRVGYHQQDVHVLSSNSRSIRIPKKSNILTFSQSLTDTASCCSFAQEFELWIHIKQLNYLVLKKFV